MSTKQIENEMTRKIMLDKDEQEKVVETPALDLSIDINDTSKLMEQLQTSPIMYWEWAKLYEKSKRAVANLKLKLKVRESSIAKHLRDTNQKISEARIDKSYFDYDDYVETHHQLNKAKQTEGNLSSILKSLEQKHSIMITVASLLKAELRQQV